MTGVDFSEILYSELPFNCEVRDVVSDYLLAVDLQHDSQMHIIIGSVYNVLHNIAFIVIRVYINHKKCKLGMVSVFFVCSRKYFLE